MNNLVLPRAIGKWYWYYISQYISISEVCNHPDETWDRRRLSQNKDITTDLIHNIVLPNAIDKWSWVSISENISILDVYKYPDQSWYKNGLSRSKNLTIDDIYRLDKRMRYDYRRYTISFSDIIII